MTLSRLGRTTAFALMLTGLVLSGCGGSSKSTAPGIQPQIANLPDDFSYQVTSVNNFTGTYTYSWQNAGIAANVNQSTTVSGGTMQLTITDGAGTQVYSHPLTDNGTFVSADGVAGTWTIRVVYTGASGTVNFRAQKKT